MDSTSSTAIAGTFLLAEAGALLYAQILTIKSFCCQNTVDATLGKNTREGTYYAYFPLRVLFVSGCRCRIFTTKYIQTKDSVSSPCYIEVVVYQAGSV